MRVARERAGRSVLGSWVGARRPFYLFFFLTRPAWCFPKILVLTEEGFKECFSAPRAAGNICGNGAPLKPKTARSVGRSERPHCQLLWYTGGFKWLGGAHREVQVVAGAAALQPQQVLAQLDLAGSTRKDLRAAHKPCPSCFLCVPRSDAVHRCTEQIQR